MENPFELIDTRLTNIEALLLELKQGSIQNRVPEGDTWFNLDEICNYLTDKPAKQTVYGWIHFGKIPYHKTGKKVRFLKSEIDIWLKTGRRKTVAEIAAEADKYIARKKL